MVFSLLHLPSGECHERMSLTMINIMFAFHRITSNMGIKCWYKCFEDIFLGNGLPIDQDYIHILLNIYICVNCEDIQEIYFQ